MSEPLRAAVAGNTTLRGVLPPLVVAMGERNRAFGAAAALAAGAVLIQKGTAPFETVGAPLKGELPLSEQTKIGAGFTVSGAYLKQVKTDLSVTTGAPPLALGKDGHSEGAAFGVQLDNARLGGLWVSAREATQVTREGVTLRSSASAEVKVATPQGAPPVLSSGSFNVDVAATAPDGSKPFGTALRVNLGKEGVVTSGQASFTAQGSIDTVAVEIAGQGTLGKAGVVSRGEVGVTVTAPIEGVGTLVANAGLATDGGPVFAEAGAKLTIKEEGVTSEVAVEVSAPDGELLISPSYDRKDKQSTVHAELTVDANDGFQIEHVDAHLTGKSGSTNLDARAAYTPESGLSFGVSASAFEAGRGAMFRLSADPRVVSAAWYGNLSAGDAEEGQLRVSNSGSLTHSLSTGKMTLQDSFGVHFDSRHFDGGLDLVLSQSPSLRLSAAWEPGPLHLEGSLRYEPLAVGGEKVTASAALDVAPQGEPFSFGMNMSHNRTGKDLVDSVGLNASYKVENAEVHLEVDAKTADGDGSVALKVGGEFKW